MKVIPAIYHLGTASRSRAVDRPSGHGGKLGEADPGNPPAESHPDGKHLNSESHSVNAPEHPSFDVPLFFSSCNKPQPRAIKAEAAFSASAVSVYIQRGETCPCGARQRQENSKFCCLTQDELLLTLCLHRPRCFVLNSH